MARLTRPEQQRQTHERLLAAGRSVLVKRGCLAATVEEIAAEAGYTRGAVCSQPDLASAVVATQRQHEEEIAVVQERHCRRALPLPQVVVLLAAVGGGLTLRRGVDPEIDVAGVLGVVFLEPT